MWKINQKDIRIYVLYYNVIVYKEVKLVENCYIPSYC